jgi:Plasmid pRiA4b ORF-3-like protein
MTSAIPGNTRSPLKKYHLPNPTLLTRSALRKSLPPPENCAGMPGFYHMPEALADPDHEDHGDMRYWIDSFDPEAFSIEAVNKRMRKVFRAPRKSKSAGVEKPKAITAKPNMHDLRAAVQTLQAPPEPSPVKQYFAPIVGI